MAIKERISSFLKRENGRISKKSILTVGAIVGSAAVASVVVTKTVEAGLWASLTGSGKTVTISGGYT